MTENAIFQVAVYLFFTLILVKPLGSYMAKVYENVPGNSIYGLNYVLGPFERLIYKICSINPQQEMGWKTYLISMLCFNLLGLLALYAILRLQAHFPLNPQAFTAVPADLAFNTAVSFTTNTNWQAYAGETSLSYFTQMTAMTVQNFLSAATGMALLIALIRGLARYESTSLGNFWVDMVRGTLYILLPLSLILAISLSAAGVIQNFSPYGTASLIEPLNDPTQQTLITEQVIPQGPVASQIAIKQLGTNGGGFFNANSAHPFENPTPLSNFLEMLAIILIPAALCYTFGVMIKDKRQGWAVFFAMLIIFIPFVVLAVMAEQQGNPAFTQFHIDPTPQENSYPGGNMEGKETRFGITNSAVWVTATTATANGSVNAMIDSFTPLGGFIPLWMMHLGEVAFGGVGCGLYGMLMMVIITVFVAGLMVGRTPEYLGKRIEAFEMKMATMAALVMPLFVLVFTALACTTPAGVSAIANPAPHGFTEILYAFTSFTNNNGSAFAGLNADIPFYNILGGIAMLIGRYWIAIPTLAIAGSLVRKKMIPISAGTLATHSPLFITLLITVTFLLSALSFLPALALGPIVEHLQLWSQYAP